MLVRERDLDALLRARSAWGVAPEAAAGVTALLRDELRPEALQALARWTREDGPLHLVLPHGLPEASDPAALELALRRRRRAACLRAFSGAPFQLACAVALLLLRIEELHAVSALAEARWEAPEPSEALRRVLRSSALARGS
jgi:hypothetical protein